MSYAAGMGTATGVGMGVGMGMHEHNYNHLHFEGFHDELERIRERDAPRKPLYRRSAEQRRQGGEARAWDEACCLPEAPRGGGYAGYAGYAGFGGRWWEGDEVVFFWRFFFSYLLGGGSGVWRGVLGRKAWWSLLTVIEWVSTWPDVCWNRFRFLDMLKIFLQAFGAFGWLDVTRCITIEKQP
jgi:hypothetical protein